MSSLTRLRNKTEEFFSEDAHITQRLFRSLLQSHDCYAHVALFWIILSAQPESLTSQIHEATLGLVQRTDTFFPPYIASGPKACSQPSPHCGEAGVGILSHISSIWWSYIEPLHLQLWKGENVSKGPHGWGEEIRTEESTNIQSLKGLSFSFLFLGGGGVQGERTFVGISGAVQCQPWPCLQKTVSNKVDQWRCTKKKEQVCTKSFP